MKLFAYFALVAVLFAASFADAGIFFRRRACAPSAGAACSPPAAAPIGDGGACPVCPAAAADPPAGAEQSPNYGIRMESPQQSGQCPDGRCPTPTPPPAGPKGGRLDLPADVGRLHLIICGGEAELNRGRLAVERFKLADTFAVNYLRPADWQAAAAGLVDGVWIIRPPVADQAADVVAFAEPAAAGVELIEQHGERLKDGEKLLDRKKLTPLKNLLDPTPVVIEKLKPIGFGVLGGLSWIVAAAAVLWRKEG